MAVVAAWRTGLAALLAAGTRGFAGWEDCGLIRGVGGGRFRLAAKELAFTQAELGAYLLEFGLEFGEAGASALMQVLPVTGLLAEFKVLSEERADIAAWQRCGRGRACNRRRGGRVRIRVRRNIHTTSMNNSQLQDEVSRKTKTCLPNSYW
jgi:hypothetical protein